MGSVRGRGVGWIVALAPLSLLLGCGGTSVGSTTAAAPPVTFGAGAGPSTPALVGSTEVGVSGDRPDSLPVAAASVGSPLPEVVVRHLQSGTWVQLKNALPSDKPLLVWFWAPH